MAGLTKTLPQHTLDDETLDIIRSVNPDVADDIERSHTILRRIVPPDESPEDATPYDISKLVGFTYKGTKLEPKDLAFIVEYMGNGMRAIGLRSGSACLTKPVVLAAIHELTKDAAKIFQINPNKIVRELGGILDGNISDVCDISAAGITLKDFSKLPRHVTAAVAEIHETRNAAGVTTRLRMHDKIGAATALARILGINVATKVDITIKNELEAKLSRALDREKDFIEGVCVPVATPE